MSKLLIIGAFLLALCFGCSKPTEFAGDGSQTGNARGTLVMADGTPASGAQIYLRPSDYLPNSLAKVARGLASSTLDTTHTDSLGQFSFQNIEPGTYVLECVEPEGNTGARIDFAIGADSIAELAIDTLKPFGSITGQISIADSMNLAGIRIFVYGLGRMAESDSIGQFLVPGLPEGKYELRIIGRGLTLDLKGEQGIEVVAGDTTNIPSSQLFFLDSSLVAYWSFDENSGQHVHDASGNGNSGLLGNSESSDSEDPIWAAGKIGSCLQFDSANNSRVIVDAEQSSLDSLGAFTYTAWINPAGYGVYGRILSRELHGDSVDEFYINLVGADWHNLGAGITNADGLHFTSNSDSNTIPLNAWQHIAVTYDDAADRTLHLFINGLETAYIQNPGIMAASLRRTSNPLIIGNCTVPNRSFIGKIDEVKIFNRVLSQREILAEVNRQ